MLDQNYITQDQYDEALADDIYSRIQAAQEKNSSTENTVYTYFEDELTDQIINDLMNIKGYTKNRQPIFSTAADLKYIQHRIPRSRISWMRNMQILPIIRTLSSMNLTMP